MPGPPPKDPSLRQRRNRTSTAATLEADPDVKVPSLRTRNDGVKWLPISRAYWRLLWSSPMAARWLPAFVPGLRRYLMLTDNFERKATPSLAAEIRLEEARYGIDNLALLRLQWGFAPPVVAKAAPPPAPSDPAPPEAHPEAHPDPRINLRLVAK